MEGIFNTHGDGTLESKTTCFTVNEGIDDDKYATEVCRNSGFSEGSVIGVATEIQDIMKERL